MIYFFFFEGYTKATGIELLLLDTATSLWLITSEKEQGVVILPETKFDIVEKRQDINLIKNNGFVYAQTFIRVEGCEDLKLFAGKVNPVNENLEK